VIPIGTRIPGLGCVTERITAGINGPSQYFIRGANSMGKWYTAEELATYEVSQ
jgi:hypothetical protein